jgi:hypothetical protein
MTAQPLLKYPPGLNIRLSDPRDKENDHEGLDDDGAVSRTLWDGTPDVQPVQPRIHKLVLPLRTRKPYGCLDGSALRKKLGHTAVMVACARQRMNRRKAASQAAILARVFNFTGEWNIEGML